MQAKLAKSIKSSAIQQAYKLDSTTVSLLRMVLAQGHLQILLMSGDIVWDLQLQMN
jgi:hypothetical protein